MKGSISPAKAVRPDVAKAVRRGVSYELLARALAYPDANAFASMGEAAEQALAVGCEGPVADLARAIGAADRPAIEREYIDLFTLATSPDCPTYEAAYVCTDMGQQTTIMADVAGFLRAFGLELGEGLRPDDISSELEFVGFLCRKEAYAIEHMGQPRVLQARKYQRQFLADHLGRWGETLGFDIARNAEAGGLYALAGEALASWIEAERRLAGVPDGDVVRLATMPFPDQRRDVGPNNASFTTAEQILGNEA